MMKQKKAKCWIITEGMAGTENQCIGVAEALGIDYTIKRIALNEPWKSLSPYLGFENSRSFTHPLSGPWPDLLIASGRKSVAAVRYIKKQSGGNTITVQIQDPRIQSKCFDLIAVPEHDPLRGSNIIVTKASPNKITLEKLEIEKQKFLNLGASPSPRIAVLIGGNSKAYTITRSICEQLAQDLSTLDGSLMITCSRRTSADNQKTLKECITHQSVYFWDGLGENPYLAMLGWADYILVTADSASMISESCTTGKPVYMIDLIGGAKRIKTLHNNLIRQGALRTFNGTLEPYTYEPLNDAKMVANAIKNSFGALLNLTDH